MLMHIAMVTAFPKDAQHIEGGVAGAAKYLVDELVKQPGVRLTVIVPKAGARKTLREQWPDFEVYRLSKKWLWSLLPGTFYDIFAGKRQIRSVLRQLSPDIVHFQGVTFLAANCKQPHVLTIHGIVEKDAMWDMQWGPLRWLKWLLLRCTEQYGRSRIPHIILISDYVRQFLPKNSRVCSAYQLGTKAQRHKQRTWRIDNPIADSFFDIDWQSEPGRIFCCSRVRPLKNTLGMIKAFAKVSQGFGEKTVAVPATAKRTQLRLAGAAEAAYLRLCQRQIKMLNLGSRVHILGNLSIEQVQWELSKANCLVIPSFQEHAPLTVQEAMAVGVPIVGARVGGIPEMVEDGKTGFLVNPYDTEDIAGAILRILSDQALARSMSQRARQIAERRFKASAVCKQTLEAYKQILAEQTCSPRTCAGGSPAHRWQG
jgi:glycosyltransferase involved in cell wall biosynthesis